MQQRYKEDGLVVIGLGFQDTKNNLTNFTKEMNINDIIFVFDIDGSAAKKYGISYGAGAVFIKRNGIVSKRFPAGFNEMELLRETYRIIK
ncbi:MAG: hypothetical protein HZB79_07415 [Deltaproteobacteria bacterium]|nr:hypothetical protein [Deltaproteobacteria bacterium]